MRKGGVETTPVYVGGTGSSRFDTGAFRQIRERAVEIFGQLKGEEPVSMGNQAQESAEPKADMVKVYTGGTTSSLKRRNQM